MSSKRLRFPWRRSLVAGTAGLIAAVLACGGSKQSGAAGGGGLGEGGGDVDTGDRGTEPGEDGLPPDAAPPPAPVTFVLKNSHTEDLAFNMNKGWQPNLIAFSGKPPKAKSILMFATHCTASCEASDEERCPLCEEPETAKAKIEAQKFETVAAGAELEVPWDGKVFVYEKTVGRQSGKKKKCQCYRTEEVPPGTYTVRAVGLRLTKQVGQNTQTQIVDSEMTLPADEPIRIELDFGAPVVPGKKKPAGKKNR
jgi:hypothetical protein